MTRVLIADKDPTTIQTIVDTLVDADRPYVIAATTAEAQQVIESCPDITLALLRCESDGIDGRELCRQIRRTKSLAQLTVMAILREEQLELGTDILTAGANHLLLDPFEPRELRMRANIVPSDQLRRFDTAHTVEASAEEPRMFYPTLDPASHRFSFGRYEGRRESWETDDAVTKVLLDRIIVCPECEAIPTFRPGCGACGGPWVEEHALIHHDACAQVGSESEVEQTIGGLQCSDCQAIFTEQKMIAHCLGCQHRFAAKDGIIKEVYGYQVGRSSQSASISAPHFQFSEVTGQTLSMSALQRSGLTAPYSVSR